jgi:hypothetical protein
VSGTGLSGCTKFTNGEGGANGVFGHWAYCTIGTTNASLTITVSYTSTANSISIVAIDLHNATASPDAGIAHVATGTGSSSASNTTNGNTQQSNGYILSGLVPVSGGTISPGTGATSLLNIASATLIQSQLAYAPGATFTATASWTTSGAYIMDTVEVLHK